MANLKDGKCPWCNERVDDEHHEEMSLETDPIEDWYCFRHGKRVEFPRREDAANG